MKFRILLIFATILLIACAKTAVNDNASVNETHKTIYENITTNKTCILNYEIGNISFELENNTKAEWQCIGILRIPIKNGLDEKITIELGLWMTRYLNESYQIPWYYWEKHFRVGGSNPDSIIMAPKKIEIDENSTEILEFDYIFDYCNINEGVKVNYGIVYGKENPKQEIICR